MTKEQQALAGLRNYLATHMSVVPPLVDGQVIVGYPDIDRLPYPTMLYLYIDSGSLVQDSTSSSLETVRVKGYVLAKGAALTSLIDTVFGWYEAAVIAITSDTSAGGSALQTRITEFDFYPALDGLANSAGLEITLEALIER